MFSYIAYSCLLQMSVLHICHYKLRLCIFFNGRTAHKKQDSVVNFLLFISLTLRSFLSLILIHYLYCQRYSSASLRNQLFIDRRKWVSQFTWVFFFLFLFARCLPYLQTAGREGGREIWILGMGHKISIFLKAMQDWYH